ncbi:MAG: glycosyltransferase family 4 protein [Hyphomicrobiales bacterium]|nr:glycosyltransferase family 4 protein [Hyphomicrobiales bacterium]
MRILLCCEFYYPSVGGVQVVMRQIAERLVAAGHEVVVATSALSNRDFQVLAGVEIVEFKVAGNLVTGLKGEVERYRDFVRTFPGDALLVKAAQQWTCDALWPILDQIKMRKVFIPCGFSAFYVESFAGYFQYLREALKKWDHLIFYADNYRDVEFARSIGMERRSIVPNGADEREFDGAVGGTEIRAKLGIADESFVFLTVGSLTGSKGHREILEAFALLETGGRATTLVLNGNIPSPASVASDDDGRSEASFLARASRWRRAMKASIRSTRRRLAYRLGLRATPGDAPKVDPFVHWPAQAEAQPGKQVLIVDLERADLVSLFRSADLFVFASNIEYSPLVLYEAAAAGLPFVTVPVGNSLEIAAWTGAGVLCPAPVDATGFTRVDPAVLAKAMGALMADPDALAELGATGRERWRRHFTWQGIAEQYEGILEGREISAEDFRRDTATVRVL